MKITDMGREAWENDLHRRRTYQKVQSNIKTSKVYDTKSFGKLLQLDGVIQLTEFDEANYHEMLAHVPLM